MTEELAHDHDGSSAPRTRNGQAVHVLSRSSVSDRAGCRRRTAMPDLVFTANAAVVLDGTALLARFRHGERQAESGVARRRSMRSRRRAS